MTLSLCDWLLKHILDSTCIERLEFIAEAIADDKSVGADYLTPANLARLRDAWVTTKKKIDMARECQASEAKAQTNSQAEEQRPAETAAHGVEGVVTTNGPRGESLV